MFAQRGERRAQLLHRAKHAVFGRARSEAERGADFVDRPSFVMPQRECRAFQRAERAQRVLHAPIDLGAFGQSLRVGRVDGRQLTRGVEALAAGLIVSSLPRAHQVDRAIRRDPVEPCRKLRPRLEPAQLFVRPQKTLLDHVFGILFVARHPIRESKHAAAVALYERAKRFVVALAGSGQDGCRLRRVHQHSA